MTIDNIHNSQGVTPSKAEKSDKIDQAKLQKGSEGSNVAKKQGDQIDISNTGKLIQNLKAEYDELSQKQIEELRAKVEAGDYKPNAQDVAAKLLERAK